VIERVTHEAREGRGWAIDDPVVRLRAWGGDAVFALPPPGVDAWTIGAAADCDLRLEDPTGCVSRHHARLVRDGAAWQIRDLGSTNGIRQDGERRLGFQLAPGVEIEIGGVALIAESARLAALHALLARVIGWRAERRADVDRALRATREAATRRTALVLCGAGDLAPVARRLHRLALGDERPFVLAADRLAPLVERAAAGTLCVALGHLPEDFAPVAAALAAPDAIARLVLCAASRAEASEAIAQLPGATLIELPPLATRADELDRLILAYADDTAAELGAPDPGFREHELVWLRDVPLAGLDEVEELARRVVALRTWGVSGGAQRLGISHVALSRWARRRKIPT
jgi:hypothetical protein